MWNIESITGYKPKTTFWDDFSIADSFGDRAIKDTFKRAFREWKDNCEYMTELVMVLNWKLWFWYEKNEARAKLYEKLWEQADDYACAHFTGDDLNYFYSTTD